MLVRFRGVSMCLHDIVRRAIANLEELQTLVFSVATLNFLVDVLLHISLENSSSSWFIETSSLQDMCRIDPVIRSPSHNMLLKLSTELKLVYGNLEQCLLANTQTTQ